MPCSDRAGKSRRRRHPWRPRHTECNLLKWTRALRLRQSLTSLALAVCRGFRTRRSTAAAIPRLTGRTGALTRSECPRFRSGRGCTIVFRLAYKALRSSRLKPLQWCRDHSLFNDPPDQIDDIPDDSPPPLRLPALLRRLIAPAVRVIDRTSRRNCGKVPTCPGVVVSPDAGEACFFHKSRVSTGKTRSRAGPARVPWCALPRGARGRCAPGSGYDHCRFLAGSAGDHQPVLYP